MKKLIGFVIAISSLSFASGQSLEDKYLGPIIEELITLDGKTYELNRKDSIITVYQRTDSVQKEVIRQYKLNEEQYRAVVKNYKEVQATDKRKEEEYLKEIAKHKRREVIIAIVAVALIILI